MTPVATTVHVGSASSVHVSSLRWAAAVHGAAPVAHVTPHRSRPGGASQTRQGAAATTAPSAEVAAVVEAAPERGRGHEATWWAEKAATPRSRSCQDTAEISQYLCDKCLPPTVNISCEIQLASISMSFLPVDGTIANSQGTMTVTF